MPHVRKLKTPLNTTHLPTAIRQALADLKAVEKDERYKVDMNCYHSPIDDQCMICLAGATLVRRMPDESPGEFCGPNTITDIPLRQMLWALNAAREGRVWSAVNCLGLNTDGLRARFITPYNKNRDQFFVDMRKLADDLDAMWSRIKRR